jgi:hypothetical protein
MRDLNITEITSVSGGTQDYYLNEVSEENVAQVFRPIRWPATVYPGSFSGGSTAPTPSFPSVPGPEL